MPYQVKPSKSPHTCALISDTPSNISTMTSRDKKIAGVVTGQYTRSQGEDVLSAGGTLKYKDIGNVI